MDPLQNFLDNLDLTYLLMILISAAASLLCITIHELSHGLAAWRLGDDTAKRAGRLTLNPIAHVDPVGLIMMLVAHVGWAKAVPVNVGAFRRPKRDMAITALAGPASNFVLAFLALCIGSLIFYFTDDTLLMAYILLFICYVAVLSVGLGVFNLIPLPPLDGSKILFSVLPDRIYYKYLRYERYMLLLVVALAWFGALDGPLDRLMGIILSGMCTLTQFPYELICYYFGF